MDKQNIFRRFLSHSFQWVVFNQDLLDKLLLLLLLTPSYDCMLYNQFFRKKLILVGDKKSGRELLFSKLESETDVQLSSSLKLFHKQIYIGNNICYILSVWDIDEQETLRAARHARYRGSDFVILCFNVLDRATLKSIEDYWREEIVSFVDPNAEYILVGIESLDNNSESTEVTLRQVTQQNALSFANTFHIPFLEVSISELDSQYSVYSSEIIFKYAAHIMYCHDIYWKLRAPERPHLE
jgi:GTPase SAR1 family protein